MVVSGLSSVDYPLLLGEAERVLRSAVPTRLAPAEWFSVVRMKDLSKSLGPPLQFSHGNYRKLLEALLGKPIECMEELELAFSAMASWMARVEELLLKGSPLHSCFSVAPKNDLHTGKKIETERLRSLCGPGLLSLLMSMRWFGDVDLHYKIRSKEAYAVQNADLYAKKTRNVRGMYTFGLDFSGFDKTIPGDVLCACVEGYLDRVVLPEGEEGANLRAFFLQDLVSPSILCPGGEILLPTGGNPSGNKLTSGLNSLVHQISANIARVALRMNFGLVCTGDDSIYGHPDQSKAERLSREIADFYKWTFGYVSKIEKMADGSVFPPGLLPPYLSMVEHWVSDREFILVAADPRRSVSSTAFYVGSPHDDAAVELASTREMVCGVLTSRWQTFFAAEHFGLPLAAPLRALWQLAVSIGVDPFACCFTHGSPLLVA